VAAALELVGLADRADDAVGGFSKGMQQRLGLAVALLGEPRLVILDEPTSALDPVGRADVRSIVRRAADAGSTIFLNSHLLTEVERVCDRVAVVDHGRVLASGRIDDLLGESSVRLRITDFAAAMWRSSVGSDGCRSGKTGGSRSPASTLNACRMSWRRSCRPGVGCTRSSRVG
jgi:ABC-2 type transport system ATP-binding protein